MQQVKIDKLFASLRSREFEGRYSVEEHYNLEILKCSSGELVILQKVITEYWSDQRNPTNIKSFHLIENVNVANKLLKLINNGYREVDEEIFNILENTEVEMSFNKEYKNTPNFYKTLIFASPPKMKKFLKQWYKEQAAPYLEVIKYMNYLVAFKKYGGSFIFKNIQTDSIPYEFSIPEKMESYSPIYGELKMKDLKFHISCKNETFFITVNGIILSDVSELEFLKRFLKSAVENYKKSWTYSMKKALGLEEKISL